MRLMISGELTEVPDAVTIAELLEHLGLTDAMVAVAVDRHHVPRSQHAHHTLREDDHVEILAPMQGG
jgi:sulfur carrier protein